MTPERQKELWAQVQANIAKLNACPRHKFDFGLPVQLGQKATCINCGGELPLTSVYQYVRGYEAGGGNGNDIVNDWG